MSEDGQVSKRRVYDLPIELVDRITAFQQDKKLPSDVEALRRLLDEALKYRDTPLLIVERIKDRLKINGLIHSVGNDVLREHPLVGTIDQSDPDYIGFTLKSGRAFRVHSSGGAEEEISDNSSYGGLNWYEFPKRPRIEKPRPEYNDDIPF